MQRIKQTKQDFIVLLSETKQTLDEQLALPQAERDAALIAECLETLDYIKGEANLPEGAFAFDSFQFFARNSSPSILCKEGAKEFKPKLTPKRHTPSVSRFFLQKAALTAAIMLLVLPYAFDGSANAAGFTPWRAVTERSMDYLDICYTAAQDPCGDPPDGAWSGIIPDTRILSVEEYAALNVQSINCSDRSEFIAKFGDRLVCPDTPSGFAFEWAKGYIDDISASVSIRFSGAEGKVTVSQHIFFTEPESDSVTRAVRLSGEFSEPYTKSIYGIDCTFAESETQNVVCFNIGFDSYTLNGDVSIETMEQIVQSLLTE